MINEYYWYITSFLMIASYYVGVSKGVKLTIDDVINIIEDEKPKK